MTYIKNNKDGEKKSPRKEKSSGFSTTSKFPDKLYKNLPEKIKVLTSFFEGMGRQKDIFLFSIIHVLSACMPRVVGWYFNKFLSANIYGMIGGPPATGKSAMESALSITAPISKKMVDDNKILWEQYKIELAEHKKDKNYPRPEAPKPNLFRIPANSTPAGMIRLLENSPFVIIAETEIDTLKVILDQKGFDYSELLRKAYHHEEYRYFRKTDNEYVELLNLHLSLLLTGTPEQLKGLLKSSENGMLSRVGFYAYDDLPKFINPFRKENKDGIEALHAYSKEVYDMFFDLLNGEEKEFRFTPEQEQRLTEKFIPMVDDFYDQSGSDAASIAMRLGVMFFRVAMILTVLRGYKEKILVCSDIDFETANIFIDTLTEHAAVVISTLPVEIEKLSGMTALPEAIVRGIPTNIFETKWFVEECIKQGGSRRTAFRLITQMHSKGLIKKVRFGVYAKVEQPAVKQ